MPYNCQTEDLQRHDRVAKFIHWTLCKNFSVPHTKKWYEYAPQPVIENAEVSYGTSLSIQTGRLMQTDQKS